MMSGWSQQAVRWWYVLRYYRMSQLAMRAWNIAKRRWLRASLDRECIGKSVPEIRETEVWTVLLEGRLRGRNPGCSLETAERLARGEFRFLNQSRLLGDPVDWHVATWPEAPRLWRFHLHYHEYLLDLISAGRATSDPAWHELAWKLVEDWMAHNRPRDAGAGVDAWHPYCISKRLPAWFLLWAAAPLEGKRGDRVLRNMHAQACFLRRNLEWDVRGNHLIENLRALALSGVFFAETQAERCLLLSERHLRKELAEQILPHGEHFERSPMYHALMLETVLDVRDATAMVVPSLSTYCDETAARMADFLEAILHPDGEIPLLGDSCFGEAPPARVLIERTRTRSAGGTE